MAVETVRCDIAILGAGPAGYVGALRAAQLGASVAVVEADRVGGTCLNRGCIPTKALLHAAEVLSAASQAKAMGIALGEPQIDWERLRKFKQRAVDQLVRGVELLFKAAKVRLIAGTGKLVSNDALLVEADGGQVEVRAKQILIATGSRPWVPPIEGADGPGVFTSDEMVNLPAPLESLAIVGGGAIGCEFAGIYAAFGTKVYLLEMMPQILPAEDADVAEALHKALAKQGVGIFTNARVTAVEDGGDGKRVVFEQDGEAKSVEASAVLVAVGRRANVEGVGLEELGVELSRHGIVVDEALRTNVEGVYAAGDCLRGVGLAHLASHEAVAAVEAALGQEPHLNYDAVPACIFTTPEVASVGLKEKEAAERGIEVTVGKFPFAANSRAAAVRERGGFVKIIAAPDGRVVGGAIVGPAAAELIAELTLAVELGASAEDIARTIHSHPTFSEAVHEAALDVLGRPIHIAKGSPKTGR